MGSGPGAYGASGGAASVPFITPFERGADVVGVVTLVFSAVYFLCTAQATSATSLGSACAGTVGGTKQAFNALGKRSAARGARDANAWLIPGSQGRGDALP